MTSRTKYAIGRRLRSYRTGRNAEIIGFTRKGGVRRARLRHPNGRITFATPESLAAHYR